MQVGLGHATGEQRELVRTARKIFADAEARAPLPPAYDELPVRRDDTLWHTLADTGLLGLGVAEDLGGSGGGAVELCLLAEEAGAAVPRAPVVAGLVTAAVLATRPGSRAAMQALGGLVDGSLTVMPAWETFPASVVPDRRAGVHRDGEQVTSRLSAVPFGTSADLVLAFDDHGPLLLDTSAPEITVTAVASLDVCEPLAALDVRAVIAPVLGDGDGLPVAALLLIHAAELVGTARRALEGAVAHSRDRVQFGRPIGSFQALKHMLADRHVELDAARMLVHSAAGCIDQGDLDAEMAARTALVAASEAAHACTRDGLQVHGGIGFTWEQISHVLLKRARARRTLLGSAERQLAALADLVLAE